MTDSEHLLTIVVEIFHRFCDSSKAQKLLNWSPTIDIDSGLLSIIEHQKSGEIGVVVKQFSKGGFNMAILHKDSIIIMSHKHHCKTHVKNG